MFLKSWSVTKQKFKFHTFLLLLGHFVPIRDFFFNAWSMGKIKERFLLLENSEVQGGIRSILFWFMCKIFNMKCKFLKVTRDCEEKKSLLFHYLTLSVSYLIIYLVRFDLTKVPDIYDMIRFDVLHNSHLEVRLGILDNNQWTRKFLMI